MIQFVGRAAILTLMVISVTATLFAAPGPAAEGGETLEVTVELQATGLAHVSACSFRGDPEDLRYVRLQADDRVPILREAIEVALALPEPDEISDCVWWDHVGSLHRRNGPGSFEAVVDLTGLTARSSELGFVETTTLICVPPVQTQLDVTDGRPGPTDWCDRGWAFVGHDPLVTVGFGVDASFLRRRALLALGALASWLLLCAVIFRLRRSLGRHLPKPTSSMLVSSSIMLVAGAGIGWTFVGEMSGFIAAVVLRMRGGPALELALLVGPMVVGAASSTGAFASVWFAARRHRRARERALATAPAAIPPLPAEMVAGRRWSMKFLAVLAGVPCLTLFLAIESDVDPLWRTAVLATVGLVGLFVWHPIQHRLEVRAQGAMPTDETKAAPLRQRLALLGVHVSEIRDTPHLLPTVTGEHAPVIRYGPIVIVWQPVLDLDETVQVALVVGVDDERAVTWWIWWGNLAAAALLAAWTGSWTLAAAVGLLTAVLAWVRWVRWRNNHRTAVRTVSAPSDDELRRADLWTFVHGVRATATEDPVEAVDRWARRTDLAVDLGLEPEELDATLSRELASSLARLPAPDGSRYRPLG